MQADLVETLTQFGIALIVVVVVVSLFAVFASGTALGRALLPKTVTDAVSKLLPYAFITDAVATDANAFQLKVKGSDRLKIVHIHRGSEATIAWTFDESQDCPPTGTYAFAEFRHNLNRDSNWSIDPESIRIRIETALREALASKQFFPAPQNEADILVSVFAVIEDEVSVTSLNDAFERQNNTEWKKAIGTALKHDGIHNPTTLACGSITIDLFDSQSMRELWRAVAHGKIVMQVSEAERMRRTKLAVNEMLKEFPPK